ncbi:MAG: DUF5666 domain-containing protein [Betaproteobacteria bacterium]
MLATIVASTAVAQPVRLHGSVAAFDGGVLTVESMGRQTTVRVSERTEIVRAEPMALSDIKSGDFLGVTSNRAADGRLTAFDIRRFPKPLNPGHRPFDGRDDQTMTNATVSATVQAAAGRELTLAYEGGSQKVLVPETASVSTLVPGSPMDLAPGVRVNLTASGEPPVAQRIQVTR